LVYRIAQSGTATIQQWGEPIEIIAMGQINDHATVTGSGTIRFIALEGGFYGILADDGNQFHPVNLDETYRVDGRRISFSAQLSDTATVVMWGEPVRITAIEDIGLCSVCRN
jgi:hypothetical protein